MPRATIELDVLLDNPDHPGREFDRIGQDDEWCRVLSAEPRISTTPSTVFADLHDTLLTVLYPAAADLTEIEGRLGTARAAVRGWAGRALAGHAQTTLDADACYMLFQLIRIISDVTAVAAPDLAAWLTETADSTHPDIEPASWRVAV